MRLIQSQLNGISRQKAECYGKPHILAEYTADDVRKYRHDEGLCPLCHSELICNTHHQPDRHSFNLKTEWGIFVLKPALFGLCGSGTTGCHGLIESNRLSVEWRWDSEEYADRWWSGYTLSHGLKPHDERLYRMGCWVFTYKDGAEREYRGQSWR